MTQANTPKVSEFVSDLIDEFSKPNTPEEAKVASLVKALKRNTPAAEKYFETQAKRAKNSLEKLNTIKIENEDWIRAVALDYHLKPLSWGGSLISATRFNNVGQPTIYLAEEESTSTKEVRFPKYLNATTLFGITVTALVLLDLSDTQNLHKHQISKKMFRGPWKSFNNIKIKYYTQYLTDILRTLPIEGFLYESVQNPGCKCLCLFPEKMIKGSTLRVIGNYESIEDEDMTYEGDA